MEVAEPMAVAVTTEAAVTVEVQEEVLVGDQAGAVEAEDPHRSVRTVSITTGTARSIWLILGARTLQIIPRLNR
jgi:hypothetical protein